MFLLDTNVISELRRSRPHRSVVAWFDTLPDASLRISAVTIGEIQRGIESLSERDAKRAGEIEAWLDRLEHLYAVLPADAAVFRIHARLMRRQPTPSYEDALIAATAIHNDLIVATRNIADFQGFDLRVVNPFDWTA
ncbi:MAG TPA: type II toxin-antitoxin system VapC family toxin [Roseiarcus sp.]|jgi:hypothetical protein